jgi:transposase
MDQDRASVLLGLEGAGVVEVEREHDGQLTVWTVNPDPDAAVCPDCASRSERVHERVLTRVRDLPQGFDPVVVLGLKRRFRCENSACARVTFTERIGQGPGRARLSERLRQHAAALVGELGGSVCAAARYAGLSWPTVHQAFARQADRVLGSELAPVRVLGIDETRRGRPRFTRDPDTETWVSLADRWHTGFVDISGPQGLLGQVEGRSADDAAYWLYQAGPAWRHQVQIVTIDMCPAYAAAVRRMLPGAELAVDVFHVVQLATKMVHDVRRRIVRQKYGRRARSGDPEYGLKNLLARNREDLTPQQIQKILDTLLPDEAGQQILLAWIAKEKLRDLIRLRPTIAATAPTPERIRHHLFDFFTWCADHAHLPELRTLAQTIDRWRDPIITAIRTGVSNARSEGLNRVIKLEGRKAYGFRNTTNQRRRQRYATTRTQRRPPTVTTRRSHPVTIPQPHPG